MSSGWSRLSRPLVILGLSVGGFACEEDTAGVEGNEPDLSADPSPDPSPDPSAASSTPPDLSEADVSSGSAEDSGGESESGEESDGDDGACPPTDGGPPPDAVIPVNLEATGLYRDLATKELAPYVTAFAPKFPLWTDGAEKHRWAYVPDCAQIDNRNPDAWIFPVGTRMWKEFRVAGQRIETRFLHRYGPGPNDYIFASYQWDDAQAQALHVPDGVVDAAPEGYAIPSEDDCVRCHGNGQLTFGGVPGRILGFDAFQLSHDGEGVTLSELVANDRLQESSPEFFTAPGDDLTQRALGYLHANCGHCHNGLGTGVWQVDLHLRLHVDDEDPQAVDAWTTAVDQPNTRWMSNDAQLRISPGDPAASALWLRSSLRGDVNQMPAIGTARVDDEGLALVGAWIAAMPSAD